MKKFDSFLEERVLEQKYDVLLSQVAESIVVNDINPEDFTKLYLELFFKRKDFNRDPVSGFPRDDSYPPQPQQANQPQQAQQQPQQGSASKWLGRAASVAGRGLGAAGGALAGGALGGPAGAVAGGIGGWKMGGQAGDKMNRKMNYNNADEVRKLDVAKRAIHDLIQSQTAYIEKNPQMKGYFEPKIQELGKVKSYLDSGLKGNMGDQFADYWTSGVPFTPDMAGHMMMGHHPMSATAPRGMYQNNPYGFHSQFNNPYMGNYPDKSEIDAIAAQHKKQAQPTGQQAAANTPAPTQQSGQFGQSIDTTQMTGDKTPNFNGAVPAQDGSYYATNQGWPTNPGDDVEASTTPQDPNASWTVDAQGKPLNKNRVAAHESFNEWYKRRIKLD